MVVFKCAAEANTIRSIKQEKSFRRVSDDEQAGEAEGRDGEDFFGFNSQ
jgi:hypothetical protein